MSDKTKVSATPAVKSKVNSRRPSTASIPATSRKVPPSQSVVKPAKDRFVAPRPKVNKNATIISEADNTIMKSDTNYPGMPEFDVEHRQVAYGKFLRAMLEDCLVDEKIEREETQLDVQMAQLADRFQKTIDHLDKTNKRLRDISFVVEQKRLIDLKSDDCSKFYKTTQESNASQLLNNLSTAEEACLDRIELKNVDFGYEKETGHKKLLDAVTEAIEGLEQIKTHSKLDVTKFEEYRNAENNLTELEKDRFDLESLKLEFEKKFPKYGEQLIKQVSEKINEVMKDDLDAADDDDSDISD